MNERGITSMKLHLIPAQDAKPVEGWFCVQVVYNFWPAKNLCTYQDIHIGGGQQQKNGAKSSKP